MLVRLAIALAIDLVLTLPFGFYRAYTRKFSVRWFLAIHVPVVFLILIRLELHLPVYFIPVTSAMFFIAQFGGSRAGRWWIKRRAASRKHESCELAIGARACSEN